MLEARSERDLAEEVGNPHRPSTSTPPGQVHEAQPDEEKEETARSPGISTPARVQGGTRGPPGPYPRPGDHRPAPLGPDRQRRNAGRRCCLLTISAITALQSHANSPSRLFRSALEPLGRPDLVLVGHNLPFDLGFLWREGIRTFGECRDTLKMLRLLDQDRGREGGQGMGRLDLQAPVGAEPVLNYRLKDVGPAAVGLKMPYFPGSIEWVPYAQHCKYLACDLLGTRALYEYLWPRLEPAGQRYYCQLVAPLIPALLGMTEVGVTADARFIDEESDRIEQLMQRLSEEHRRTYGVAMGMDQEQLGRWLFGTLGLPVLKHGRRGTRWVPSLDAEALRRLEAFNEDPHTAGSLRLIRDYRKAASLMVRLRSLAKYVDAGTGRIHSTFDDRQATGRLSSTYPNLQQLAKKRELAKTESDPGVEIRSRNALIATQGYELAVFDIGQADIPVLASMVENFPVSAKAHLANLRKKRLANLGPTIQKLRQKLHKYRNPTFRSELRGCESKGIPSFKPLKVCGLAEDFRTPGDFYAKAVERILDRPPRDKAERQLVQAHHLGDRQRQGGQLAGQGPELQRGRGQRVPGQVRQGLPRGRRLQGDDL